MESRRQELDPPETTAVEETAAPPEDAAQKRAEADDIAARLDELIELVGGEPGGYSGRLVRELLTAGLKLIPDGRDTGQLKLMTTAVKELRYAYRVFGEYAEPKITIFGSARTPEDHPDYYAAVEFSRYMAEAGWMVTTGAGPGIMKAGHEGPSREAIFGAAIRLPAQESANELISGDEKLVNFRYFFTRKLIFLSQCDAVALFPGGYGTMDEAFETLTLVQTGKASMLPIVLLEGKDGTYWPQWRTWVEEHLLANGMISPADLHLFHVARDPADAAEHIRAFYRMYHSARYVGDDLVIRMQAPLAPADVERLGHEFADLIASGTLQTVKPYRPERDHLDLPRIAFTHTRRDYGRVRQLIDALNRCSAP
jgi:uncharacterized protein (TIGR00730 family)